MAHLATLVSSDSRPFLARVRRYKLHQIAEGEGIPFPPGAPAKDMIPLLQNLPEQTILKYMQVSKIVQEDEAGRQHVEAYPIEPQHASAGRQEQVAGVLLERISPSEQKIKDKQAEFDTQRLARLEKENTELKALFAERLDKLEHAAPAFPVSKLLPWQLVHVAKERGIAYKGLSKEDLVAALEA